MPRRVNHHKSAKEIVTTIPGWVQKRDSIILALCQGQTDSLAADDPELVGHSIVLCANQIIEELYNFG